jgi:signal transduction histidine kinase
VSERVAEVIPGGLDARALPALSHRAQSAHRVAATVTGVFAVAGLAWVFLTDVALYGLVRDRALIARVETAKGWAFITLASLLLYAVAFRSAARLDRVRRLTAAVVDSIADGILLLGHDRRIAYANPAAVRMLRCPQEQLIGMSAADFSLRFRLSDPNGAVIPPGRYVSQRAFDEGGPLHYKVVFRLPGGGEIVASVIAAGVRKQLGEPAMWVVSVMHDITDTEHLERMRDQFFAATAHSLKTPVAVIKANAQALLRAAPPQQRKVVASIDRQCDRIDRVVQNLMILSRARSGGVELFRSDLELRPMMERIAREALWSFRHDVRTEISGAPSIHCDPERVALVVRNLLYEATRMSPPESSLTLLVRPDGNRVAIGVRYQPSTWRDRTLEPYDEYDDIGIGRSVAETIVAGHGGALRDETTDAEKTSWIYLPAGAGANP